MYSFVFFLNVPDPLSVSVDSAGIEQETVTLNASAFQIPHLSENYDGVGFPAGPLGGGLVNPEGTVAIICKPSSAPEAKECYSLRQGENFFRPLDPGPDSATASDLQGHATIGIDSGVLIMGGGPNFGMSRKLNSKMETSFY